MSTTIDQAVIGGGLAGSLTAFRLAAAGRKVILFEKQREAHHKVCGEFLSTEALGYLQRIGIDAQALGAHPIHSVRLHSGRRSVQANLPFAALSLSRRVLDEVLLRKAQSAGCEVRRGTYVEAVNRNHGGFTIQLRDEAPIHAGTVFLATGKHDVPELPRAEGSHPHLVGFKMHWQLAPSSNNAIRHVMELFLFRDGYGGLALVEDNIANLCFVIHKRRMRELGGWAGLLSAISSECPALGLALQNAIPCWPKPLAISPIPYGYIARTSSGIWRIGDQAAVIPSFTGDGMSIALHSAELASEMYLSGKSPDKYLRMLEKQLRPGMRFATSLSRMMVTSTGRLLAPAVLSLLPGSINWIAERTRIPNRALKTVSGPHAATARTPVSA